MTISTKPYLIRAIFEWCTDNGYTPYLAVKVLDQVRVPMEYVQKGEIVLNISFAATSGLKMDNEAISFKARFGGVAREVYVPINAVAAIYSGENNQGMAFDVVAENAAKENTRETTKETAKEATKASASEKSTISLAVTNTENSTPDGKKPKESRKKPGLTVIK